jgi:hypothetical protein
MLRSRGAGPRDRLTKCAILQPSYVPWRGYFHQIRKSDIFIFFDDVQYDKRGWRNRNRIKTASGTRWLTIPVNNSGAITDHIPINHISINWDTPWNHKHWTTLTHAYHNAPFFSRYRDLLESFYASHPESLADFTIEFTVALAASLGIKDVKFLRSSELGGSGRKTERLLDLLRKVGATHYISGPSAKDYLDEAALAAAGITLEYMLYDYPHYEQLYPPYDPQVSILDLLFMKGEEAGEFIW